MEKDVDNDKTRAQADEQGKQPQNRVGQSPVTPDTDETKSHAKAAAKPESGKGREPDNKEPEKTVSAKNAGQAKQPDDTQKAANTQTKQKRTPASGRKTGGFRRFLLWLFVLLLLVAGAFAAWIYIGEGRFEEVKRAVFSLGGKETTSTIGPLQSAIEADDVDVVEEAASADAGITDGEVIGNNTGSEIFDSSAVSAAVENVAASVEALSSRVADNQLQLSAQQERLRQLAATSREDWLLSEAEYLLRLANQRILTERQTRNALALLLTVDDIFKELDQPDLFAVRKSLARDITSLKLAGVTDREGIYLRLDALISSLSSLDAPKKVVAVDQAVAPGADESWYSRLAANAWQALVKMSGIVRVERVDVPLDPVLLPSEEALLRLNLRLALEQAQLALMREEQAIYNASLEKAMTYVAASFGDTPAVAVFVEELESLTQEQVTQPLPLLGDTIKALQDYIHLWHNRFEGPTGAGGNGGEGQ